MRHLSPAVLVLAALAPAAVGQEAKPIIVPRPDALPTLVNPQCSHCRDEAKRRAGELRDDDRVLCWLRGYSDGGAIPWRFFLNAYPVISDTYGVFVHDPDAGFARGFAPSLDFRFHGWRNGVMVMRHKDGTLYSCLTGVAFDGPRKGDRLNPVPTLVSDWGYWLKHYPQAVAYHLFDKYQPVEAPAAAHADSVKSRGRLDPRLPADAPVLGVSAGGQARAYPLDALAKTGLVRDELGGAACVVLWYGPTRSAAAYRPVASPPKKGPAPRPVTLARDEKRPDVPFVDRETGSHWDVAGRAVDGELKGWTLEWLDGTQVKWFAWAAEYPRTDLHQPAKDAGATKVNDAVREIAGSAEVLKAVPKKFAVLRAIDRARHAVTLRCDGDKDDKLWPLTPDAEVKVQGWWGRLDDLPIGGRVWVWFKVNRAKAPAAVFMIADEPSEADIHGRAPASAQLDASRAEQKRKLTARWEKEGLPGTVLFTHLSGELDYLLDHEAMRWGRSLVPGDTVHLQAEPPIKAVVKSVRPWRERTQLRLVVGGFDLADLQIGDRVRLKMTPPTPEVQASELPPDLDRPRGRGERIEWFLASMYCTCGVTGDICTGHFYTLASCNPNGCGAPKAMRQRLGKMIDEGMTDRQIFERLLSERGPRLVRPHLLP